MSSARPQLLRSLVEVTKPRIVTMVVMTCALGYYLGALRHPDWINLLWVLLGTGLAAGGSAALNNFLERDTDAVMWRTRGRAIPSGRLQPEQVLFFGLALVALGVTILVVAANLLAAFIVLATAFLYVLVYTPMKRLTWLNTSVGAIPGALPPLTGWVAATGEVEPGALLLFAILYFWQHPHFFAIAWLCREDYARGGMVMLSVVDPTGRRVAAHALFTTLLLVATSLMPVAFRLVAPFYIWGAGALGLWFVWEFIGFARDHSQARARRAMRASLLYLPALMVLMAIPAGLLGR